ncbi:flavin reductase [Candidatus Magnetoovum chiemensis]|nr:flavin reductase [Candidatus Magnetoovum chiemensis]
MAILFEEKNTDEFTSNPFKLIGSDWMLVAAGNLGSYNMMTASWGGFGVIWDKKVCFCTIRPTRYTYEFMERSEYFSLSFFDKRHRKTLLYCGTFSGKSVDKAKETGLEPIEMNNTVTFTQASTVFICRKVYYQDIKPEFFLDNDIHSNYPKKDYHRLYMGEIVKYLTK